MYQINTHEFLFDYTPQMTQPGCRTRLMTQHPGGDPARPGRFVRFCTDVMRTDPNYRCYMAVSRPPRDTFILQYVFAAFVRNREILEKALGNHRFTVMSAYLGWLLRKCDACLPGEHVRIVHPYPMQTNILDIGIIQACRPDLYIRLVWSGVLAPKLRVSQLILRLRTLASGSSIT